MGFFYRNQLRLEATFLEYTRRYLHEVASNYAYILLFLIFTAGLFALFIFQHCAFSSKGHSDRNFFNFFNPGFLGVLNVIELIWGLRFLRDAFNYCVSGNAADWYWGPQLFDSQAKVSNIRWSTSFHRLITKNWGSVAGGSFINAFFEIPSLLLELVVCHKKTCCSRLGETCDSRCSCFSFISDLVRTDAYAFIHFSGLGFCTAARECAKINRETDTFVGTQNPFKRYRFIVHVFAVALLSFLGYLFANVRVININFWHIATIITLSYAVVTWFIDIYGAGAEGVSTCFYAEHYTARSYEFMQRAIPVLYLLLSPIARKSNTAALDQMSFATETAEPGLDKIAFIIIASRDQTIKCSSMLACLDRLSMAFSSWTIDCFMCPIMRV